MKKKEASPELQVMSKLARKRKINPNDFFLVRDYANRILIATEDATMTAVIMLNMTHGSNEYESDVPRLIHDLKSSGYDMPFVIYLTKGDKRERETSMKNYVYEGCIYQIETIAIQS